jgi:hypothetical protein
MLNFVMLQVEIFADMISQFGIYTVLLAIAVFWIQKLLLSDERTKKEDRVRLLATLDKYEARLNEHDKFKEGIIKELTLLLKENHSIIRETNEINKDSIRILSIISNKNSHSL